MFLEAVQSSSAKGSFAPRDQNSAGMIMNMPTTVRRAAWDNTGHLVRVYLDHGDGKWKEHYVKPSPKLRDAWVLSQWTGNTLDECPEKLIIENAPEKWLPEDD
jgi:hypothetical protein